MVNYGLLFVFYERRAHGTGINILLPLFKKGIDQYSYNFTIFLSKLL